MNTQPISVKLREERERDFEAEIEINKGDEGFETVGFVVAFEIKSELGVASHFEQRRSSWTMNIRAQRGLGFLVLHNEGDRELSFSQSLWSSLNSVREILLFSTFSNMKALARTSGLIGGLDPNTALAMVITPGFWLPNPAKAKAGVFPILNWK
ncbi:hypothetical protein F8388_002737 [Cannabis sativa]|uniref:Uncharacterized protein n=1 Tax=Cannabis sativa TaxID=3483 RepID=A0A7J6F578_CANSA|nr:hypothetical protein F8388_002737 [Cannabis sativa]